MELKSTLEDIRSSNGTKPNQPSKKKRLRKKSSEAMSSTPVLEQTEDVEDADISDFCTDLENNLVGNEGTSLRDASSPSDHQQ
ncbi:hypothetical protein Tco_0410702 [Tanacetum coccineum]